jgi:hypothetical protein
MQSNLIRVWHLKKRSVHRAKSSVPSKRVRAKFREINGLYFVHHLTKLAYLFKAMD